MKMIQKLMQNDNQESQQNPRYAAETRIRLKNQEQNFKHTLSNQDLMKIK